MEYIGIEEICGNRNILKTKNEPNQRFWYSCSCLSLMACPEPTAVHQTEKIKSHSANDLAVYATIAYRKWKQEVIKLFYGQRPMVL